MTPLLLTLTICTVPFEDVAQDRADVLEVNRYYDEDGRHVFTQLIAWDWDGADFRVFAWRLMKSPEQHPLRDPHGYTSTWQDGDVMRRVSGRSRLDTWTQFDPELFDRQYVPKSSRRDFVLPQCQRRGLGGQ